MPRYIDADALISKLTYHRDDLSRSNVTAVSVLNNVIEIIERRPTVSPDDARGVGKWTNKRTIEHDGEWWCTACGKEITIYMGKKREDRYKFCPNCGAKMEETE